MDRVEYNNCLSPWIKGKGIDKEARKLRFCVGAKICSKKAKNEAEATTLCNLPKEPKAPKKKRGSKVNCAADMKALTVCIIGKIDKNTLAAEITKILMECHCGKAISATPKIIRAGDVNKAHLAQAKVSPDKEFPLDLMAMVDEYGTA